MIFGDLGGLKLPDICLTGEGKPRKNLSQETCPDRGSNPDPLCDRHACYRLAHSGGPLSFNVPQRKKFNDIKSEDQAGYLTGSSRPKHRFGNFASTTSLLTHAKCAGYHYTGTTLIHEFSIQTLLQFIPELCLRHHTLMCGL